MIPDTVKTFFLTITLLIGMITLPACSKKDANNNNNTKPPATTTSGKGSFTFKGITYAGTCSVIPDDASLGFQWFMSITDDAKDAALSIGTFPQETNGNFGLCADPNGRKLNGRNGVIRLGSSDLYSINFGKITKLSKTKFRVEGSAFADLSDIPLPFTAEGDIEDLTGRFTVPDKSPYPAGTGSVSIFTDKPLNGDTLYLHIRDAATKEFVAYGGRITYHQPGTYNCGESESFFFLKPGSYTYETYPYKAGAVVFNGTFNVQAGTCNAVRINR